MKNQNEIQTETDPMPEQTISQAVQKVDCSILKLDIKLDAISKLNE